MVEHRSDRKRLVAEHRWTRKRRLLPNLKLKYPSQLELEQLSKLANVDDRSIFGSHIRGIILDAHLNDASLRKRSVLKAQNKLKTIASRAEKLSIALQEIDVGAKGSAEHAGRLLEYELGSAQTTDQLALIPEHIQFLNRLNAAAVRASESEKPKHGPLGAGGNYSFDMLVQSLQMAAWQRRGDWTIYREAAGTWTGSLLTALHMLRPYLPKGMFPPGKLGRAIEHVRKKLKAHITKNTALRQ